LDEKLGLFPEDCFPHFFFSRFEKKAFLNMKGKKYKGKREKLKNQTYFIFQHNILISTMRNKKSA
jgi:hypothetical protein